MNLQVQTERLLADRQQLAQRASRSAAGATRPAPRPAARIASEPATRAPRRTATSTGTAAHLVASTIKATTGTAATIVAFALAQVGKPYVWAADGPGSFDCSGLVKAAYARVGISLPHQSGSIGRLGQRISRSELQPADVVVWSGHVAVYIGGGLIVEAANERDGVRKGRIWGSPIAYIRLL